MKIELQRKASQRIHSSPILQQSAFWSEVKSRQGIPSKAFRVEVRVADLYVQSGEEQLVTDDVLILFENMADDYYIGYVPYGPKLKPSDENQGVFLEELSETLRPHLPPKCLLLRYDLLWESLWAKDDFHFSDNGEWGGPPDKIKQELRLNFLTQNWNLRKANTNILPSDTIFIDLSKDEDQLLREMKTKTRYNVRLSARKGVQVRKGDSSDLDLWYDLYRQTCQRNHIFLHHRKYFETVLSTPAPNGKSPAGVELLIAEAGQQPLAAMFLSYSGARATYLYGASASHNRHLMATYALQWAAIGRAKARGCTEYDMFGISPQPDPSHPLYGLYRFKSGFGGRIFHRLGCWDYPLDPDGYKLYQTSEMHSQGYHLR